jgi:hypothetical protein
MYRGPGGTVGTVLPAFAPGPAPIPGPAAASVHASRPRVHPGARACVGAGLADPPGLPA